MSETHLPEKQESLKNRRRSFMSAIVQRSFKIAPSAGCILIWLMAVAHVRGQQTESMPFPFVANPDRGFNFEWVANLPMVPSVPGGNRHDAIPTDAMVFKPPGEMAAANPNEAGTALVPPSDLRLSNTNSALASVPQSQSLLTGQHSNGHSHTRGSVSQNLNTAEEGASGPQPHWFEVADAPNLSRSDNQAIHSRYQQAWGALPPLLVYRQLDLTNPYAGAGTPHAPALPSVPQGAPLPAFQTTLTPVSNQIRKAAEAVHALPGQEALQALPLPQVPPGMFQAEAAANESDQKGTLKAPKYGGQPEFFEPFEQMAGHQGDALTRPIPYQPDAFLPLRVPAVPSNPVEESDVYRGKYPVPVQRPWVELWRPLYASGIYPPAKDWFGRYNPVMPHFMVYGDFRTGVGVNRNDSGDADSLAFRANLEMDLELTATERIHGFIAPLDRTGDFTRLDFTDDVHWVDRTDLRLDNLFFEGDVGAIWGGLSDQDAPFDLPITFGFLPFFYQNGIWANDNAIGAAFALPAKHSRLLKWSNYDATFFWASDQINSDAFAEDNNAAEFFGTAWFIEAYDGYFEVDYAFVHDDVGQHRSYHNFSVGFTRRYFQRISNSVRLITNFNQSLPSDQRTADGHLLLIENALITAAPNTVVPYLNFFYGQGATQSLARAAVAGGVLNNTGINFETDGLTGYPTLDATGVNTTGAALGINLLGQDFDHQLIVELAALAANGSDQFRNAPGDQYALGMRYQRPLNNAWIFRTDHMFGLLRNADDIRGSRVELRWKF